MYEQIMESAEFNQKLFHKIIRTQRTIRTATAEILIVDGKELTQSEDILDGWKHHFETLGTPQQTSANTFHSMIELETEILQQTISSTSIDHMDNAVD